MGPTKIKEGSPKPKRASFKKLRDRINPVSRQAKIFSSKLGKVNIRSDNSRNCKGLETPSDRQTSSMEGTKPNPNDGTGKDSSTGGNLFNDTEGCPDRGTICEGSVHIKHICETKKGTKQDP